MKKLLSALWDALYIMGCGVGSFICFYLISSVENPDDSMEVGIGVVGMVGVILAAICIGGIISKIIYRNDKS